MPFLSPAKLLVILVVALFVLGPDKLPRVARQIGSLWSDFRKLRERLESDVRGSFPDLPSTDSISRAVHSPLAFLDSLADGHGPESDALPPDHESPADPIRPAGTAEGIEQLPWTPIESPPTVVPRPDLVAHEVRAGDGLAPDPGLN
jgi:mttA/Hcf106 family